MEFEIVKARPRSARRLPRGGEPQSRVPGQPARFGTTVREDRGGYIIDGTKAFATSARAASWAILLVNLYGPGGARHSTAADGLLLLVCDLTDPSVSFDESWWDPIGMRGTVSYLAQFDQTFIPAENRLGRPGQYLREDCDPLLATITAW